MEERGNFLHCTIIGTEVKRNLVFLENYWGFSALPYYHLCKILAIIKKQVITLMNTSVLLINRLICA